jgi:hypothetical protein
MSLYATLLDMAWLGILTHLWATICLVLDLIIWFVTGMATVLAKPSVAKFLKLFILHAL